MKKFFAYILLCTNIIFGIGISAKHVISNIKSNHDYSYNKQITIKFDFKKKDEIRENIEYIEKKLIESNEFNYKISYFEDGIINIFLVKNNKNFNKVSDLLDDKKIELCYIENGKNGENIEKSILMDDSWKANIETQNEEKKIIISIPKNEIDNVYNLYLKSFDYETEKIERILKSDFSKTNVLETKKQKNFFIRIRFKFKNKTKKIILHHEIFYEKNGEKNKFKIIFPSKNNKKIYNEYKQEEDIDYYQKILNSNDKKNYKIIDINNINKPLNKLNETFFILIATFIISFLTLVFIYRFNSIAIITAVILQLFLTIFSFLITKQFFNTKAFFGLIIISLMSLLTYSMQNIFFYRKMENGDNSKNASLEAYQKTKPIIFTVSIFYLILCLTIYFFTNKNEDFLGITNIFFINAIINFFIHHLVFNKLTWLINNSSITKKRYEIFSQFKNNQKEEFLSEDYEFSLKKEKKIFFIFITTFLIFLTLTFNFKFFFKEDIFKHKNFTDNIRITLKNHNKSIPYLLNFINEIKINDHVINFD
ncbi:hypothetical protein II654_01960, partial [bacterium]|nr:hypothetical protein [bacterium]